MAVGLVEESSLPTEKADIILTNLASLQGQVTEVYREVGHISSTADKAWLRLDHHGQQIERNAKDISTLQEEARGAKKHYEHDDQEFRRLWKRINVIERTLGHKLALPAGAGAVGAALITGVIELVKLLIGG